MNTQRSKALCGMPSLVIAMGLVAGISSVDAQYVEHWRQEGPEKVAGGDYFTHDRAAGMAYNPVTDNVLMAVNGLHTVPDARHVLVFDAEDGAIKQPMTTTGILDGMPRIKKIAAVDRGDGEYSIYVCLLTDDAKYGITGFEKATEPFRLWRWAGSNGADESTIGAPTLIYQNQTIDAPVRILAPEEEIGPPLPAVSGTTFDIGHALHARYDSATAQTMLYIGSGRGAVIMTVDEQDGVVSGVELVRLETEDGSFINANSGISTDSAGNMYTGKWVHGPEGEFLEKLNEDLWAGTAGEYRIMEVEDRRFLGHVWRPNPATKSMVRILDLTAGAENATVHSTTVPLERSGIGLTRLGDIALDTRRGRFLGLITNNMLVSFSQEEEAEPFAAISRFEARVNEPAGTVTVDWETSKEVLIAGFNVYRLVEDDPAISAKLNGTLIPAVGSGGGGAAYSIEDAVVLAPGEPRSYLLERVDINGGTASHGTVTVIRQQVDTSVRDWGLY